MSNDKFDGSFCPTCGHRPIKQEAEARWRILPDSGRGVCGPYYVSGAIDGVSVSYICYGEENATHLLDTLNAQSGITISRECADLASSLFTEVILVHADPTDAEYSECENPESRCMWCVDAMKIIEALESK